jgi:hypothetical protein
MVPKMPLGMEAQIRKKTSRLSRLPISFVVGGKTEMMDNNTSLGVIVASIILSIVGITSMVLKNNLISIICLFLILIIMIYTLIIVFIKLPPSRV